jgi:hypothetical protein
MSIGVDSLPDQNETQNNIGTTESYTGTATTTPADVGSGNVISGAIIVTLGRNIEVSFDGGSSYFPMPKKSEAVSVDVKGEPTSIKIKTTSGTADYKMILHHEDY